MSPFKKFTALLGSVLVVSFVTAGAVRAGETPPAAVGAGEIQERLDQGSAQADADRQAIQDLLQRADVRKIADAAGLDIERAAAAASVLSGDALAQLAAQARTVPVDLAGGSDSIVLPVTTIIIVLLVIILLAA